MSKPDITSRSTLARLAYRDGKHLAARQSLYAHQQPKYDLPGIVLEHLPATVRTLLDVGCGNGAYMARIRAERPEAVSIGVDISAGIMSGVPAPTFVGDAAALPVADQSADAVLEMHMLYHVEDIDGALAEAARVLRPRGLFVVSTNSRHDKQELGDLWSAAAADVLGVREGPRRLSLSDRFSLEAAVPMLSDHFLDIEVVELPGTITVNEPGPVIAHFESYRAWADSVGVPFDETIERAGQLLSDILEREGAFHIEGRGGLFLARTPY